MLSRLGKFKFKTSAILLTQALSVTAKILSFFMFVDAVNNFNVPSEERDLIKNLSGYAGLIIAGSLLEELAIYISENVSRHLCEDFEGDVFSRLISHDQSYFDNGSPEKYTQYMFITKDLSYDYIKGSLFLPFKLSEIGIFSALIAQNTSWFYFPVALAASSLYVAGYYHAAKWLVAQSEVAKHMQDSSLRASLNDTFLNLLTVRSLNGEREEEKRFLFHLKNYLDANKKAVHSHIKLSSFQNIFVGLTIYGVILYTGLLVLNPDVEFEKNDFITINTFLLNILTPLFKSNECIRQVVIGKASFKKLNEDVFQYGSKDKKDEKSGVVALPGDEFSANRHLLFKSANQQLTAQPEIDEKDFYEEKTSILKFNEVSFKFPQTEILSKASFEINQGEVVAIVGKSGIGKSTIVKLLLRMHRLNQNEGNITFFDQNIADFKEQEITHLRSKIMLLPQSTQIFSSRGDHLKDILQVNNQFIYNLFYPNFQKYGNLDLSKNTVASSLEFCSLNNKYNSYIEQKPPTNISLFSQGEKQRLGIARIFANKNRPVLYVLDETTSNLDANTEGEIVKTFNKMVKDDAQSSSLLVITHRLDTIKNANKIYLLDDDHTLRILPYDELVKKFQTESFNLKK